MKIYQFKQLIFKILIGILLILPPLSFIFYTFGVFFNFNNLNFIIYILLILLSISCTRTLKREHLKFFRLFVVILILNLCGHILYQGSYGIIDFLRTVSGYYIFVFIGWILYKLFIEKDEEIKVLKFVVKMGIFISIINFLHFIFISTDKYTLSDGGWSITFNHYNIMIEYLRELNKAFSDYILIGLNYDNALRPVGFFYDTHSQYYFPLATCVILFIKKDICKHRNLWLTFIISTIILSSIKTAVLSILIVSFIWCCLNLNIIKLIKKAIPALLLFIILFKDKLFAIFGGENISKILIQLINHFIFVPFLYFSNYIVGFFIGGATFLRDETAFYSEVFWVTVLFYIGIIGIIIYIKPIKLLKQIKDNEIGSYIFIIMALSMTHYGVYVVGVNNVVTSIPFMYYFSYLSNKNKVFNFNE